MFAECSRFHIYMFILNYLNDFCVASAFSTTNFSHRIICFLPSNMKFAKATLICMWVKHKNLQKYLHNSGLLLSFTQNYIFLNPIKRLSCAKNIIAHRKLPLPCNQLSTFCYIKAQKVIRRTNYEIDRFTKFVNKIEIFYTCKNIS